MKAYERAELEIICFDSRDAICTSEFTMNGVMNQDSINQTIAEQDNIG